MSKKNPRYTVRLPKPIIWRLEQEARRLSYRFGRDIKPAELMAKLLDERLPSGEVEP